MDYVAYEEEHVARNLGIRPDRIDVSLEKVLVVGIGAFVGMIEAESHSHDEVVFVAISQQRIVGGYLVDEIIRAFRQIDIIDIYGGEYIAVLVFVVGPFIRPSGIGDNARVFRAFLISHRHIKLRSGVYSPFESFGEERGFELGEGHAKIKGIFHVAVVDKSVEISAKGFVGATDFSRQCFRTLSHVAVGVGG